MGRFLFVVPPLVGHINPTISAAAELEALGHQVAWVGHPRTVRPRLAEGATLYECDDELPDGMASAVMARGAALRGPARLKFLWEDFFVPLARAMLPQVQAAVDAFAPDVLIADQQTIAGALVARRQNLAWATFATTSAGVVEPLASLPKVQAWLDDLMAGLQRHAGLPVVRGGELSPQLIVAFTTTELVGEAAPVAATVRFVGPSISARPGAVDFPWHALRDMPRLLVSLGTVNAGAGKRLYSELIEALTGQHIQAIIVGDEAELGAVPDNIVVRSFVPQLALLAKVDGVVCHAGHNTVVEALANGLPLVVAPIKDDQPVVADQVVSAGAGVRVKFGRVRAPKLRQAIDSILTEPSYAAAARSIGDSFVRAGGARRAATLLEELLP